MCDCDKRLQAALRAAEFGVPDRALRTAGGNRERLQFSLLGATGWVEETIHLLHI